MNGESFQKLPEQNERIGPIHQISIEVPKTFLSLTKDQKIQSVLALIPSYIIKKFPSLDGKVFSEDLHFRGFTRESSIDPVDTFNLEWRDIRSALSRIHDVGHEMIVKEPTDIRTTNNPLTAIGFGSPKKRGEVGYLCIYNNEDAFFDEHKIYKWASQTPLQTDQSSLRDRLELVIEFKIKEETRIEAFRKRVRQFILGRASKD